MGTVDTRYDIGDLVDVVFPGFGILHGGHVFQLGKRANETCYCVQFGQNKSDRLFFIDETHIRLAEEKEMD
jgi:hypothetical protein